MKKFSLLIVTALLLSSFSLGGVNLANAKAENHFYYNENVYNSNEYLRIIDSSTPFFSDFEGKKIQFYLPYTYYVRVLEKGETLTHVECIGDNIITIDGYTPTAMLYKDNQSITSPYVNISLRIKTTATMFSDSNCTNPIRIVYNDRSLSYYGTFIKEDGTRLFYVSYYNKVGYVMENDIEPFTIPNHPNELTFLTPTQIVDTKVEEPQDSDTKNDKNLISLRIIIFACLVLAGGLALVFSLKNKAKTKPEINYYDENDYE